MKKLFPEKAQVGTVKRAYLVEKYILQQLCQKMKNVGGTSIN